MSYFILIAVHEAIMNRKNSQAHFFRNFDANRISPYVIWLESWTL